MRTGRGGFDRERDSTFDVVAAASVVAVGRRRSLRNKTKKNSLALSLSLLFFLSEPPTKRQRFLPRRLRLRLRVPRPPRSRARRRGPTRSPRLVRAKGASVLGARGQRRGRPGRQRRRRPGCPRGLCGADGERPDHQGRGGAQARRGGEERARRRGRRRGRAWNDGGGSGGGQQRRPTDLRGRRDEARGARLRGLHSGVVSRRQGAGDGLRGRDREALERWERRGRRRWRWRRRRRWRRGGCLCVVHLAAHSRRGLGDNYNRSSSCPPGGQDPRRHHARLVPVRQPARHGLVRRRRAPVVGERRLARALARAALGAYLLPQVGEAAAW